MRTLFLVLALTLAFTASAASGATSTGLLREPTEVTLMPSPLVGRWSLVETCPDAIAALQKAGLASIAPSVVGGYFPNSTPQELAAKPDICSGASPTKHSHFFTERGTFGSLDQNSQQVDNGHYRILSHHRLRINNGTFRYRIINGNQLQLAPIITAAMRSQALASPFKFSVAGWEVAVSYTGQTWKRVRCAAWCSS